MAEKLQWNQSGENYFEAGVEKGVLFVQNADGSYPLGVAWNGLTGVTESPTGAEVTDVYADNRVYANLTSAEKFEGTIEAYTYPDEFGQCDGSVEAVAGLLITGQSRVSFGMAYRTKVGNDTEGEDFAYKIHLIYGATASPSERARTSIGESTEPITLSWSFKTKPEDVPGLKESAHLVIDSRTTPAPQLAALEAALYGVDAPDADAYLPLPAEVITLLTP